MWSTGNVLGREWFNWQIKWVLPRTLTTKKETAIIARMECNMWLDIPIWAKFVMIFLGTFFVKVYSSAGGGGRLVLIPLTTALFGLDPSVVIATLRFGSLGSIGAVREFHKERNVDWKLCKKIIPFAIFSTIIGSYFVFKIDQEMFGKIISISILLALLVGLWFNYRSSFKRAGDTTLYSFALITGITGALIGFRGVIMRSLYLSRGLNHKEASGTHKATSLVCNVLSAAIFWKVGLIDWPIALTLFSATTLGSWLGAYIVNKIHGKWTKWIFITSAATGAIIMLLK